LALAVPAPTGRRLYTTPAGTPGGASSRRHRRPGALTTAPGFPFQALFLVVERQSSDLDDLQPERRRRDLGDGPRDLAAEGLAAKAADEDGDVPGRWHPGGFRDALPRGA
jgi:hypothetical protein